MLKEARRLFDLGWAVHWIRPNSKAPVKKGWTTGPRDEWETVEKDYAAFTARYGRALGLGVRVGEASKLPCGSYLANIDVDVKGADARHRKEALAALEKLYPGVYAKAPIVRTGYGLRIFVKTKTPLDSVDVASSEETCIVRMETSDVTLAQRKYRDEGLITDAQLKDGYRVRPAWELSLMSKGRQVVLPPSIHPDTKKPYSWARPLGTAALPLVTGATKEKQRLADNITNSSADIPQKFVPVNVDLISSTLPDKIVNMILAGDGVVDRSAALLTVSLVMVRHGFTDAEILSILTDRETYLGETGYEHAKSGSRQRAAYWIREHTLKKARRTVDAETTPPEDAFAAPVGDGRPPLPAEAAKAQAAALRGLSGWEARIKRMPASKSNPDPKPERSLENTVLVLQGAFGPDVFRLNTFTSFETYGRDVPWPRTPNARQNLNVTDACVANVKLWLGQNYRFEPGTSTVEDAIKVLAVGNCYHPIIEELEALPPWDGTERIGTWLKKYWGAEGPDEYLAQVFRKWLIASITRVHRPGTKFDWMPIFEGDQGYGKQTFFTVMFGQRYHSDAMPSLQDKDAALNLEGLRVQEFGELESLTKNEINTVKGFLSRLSDKVRRPYGRRWEELPRQTVFAGSTNNSAYLKDETGNRRFNPIRITRQIDFKALHRDRSQLWAEAYWIYQNELETTLELEGAALKFALETRRDKLVEDESSFYVSLWEAFVKREKAKPAEQRFDFGHFKLASLFDEAFGPFGKYKADNRALQSAGKALRAVGATMTPLHGRNFWSYDVKTAETSKG